ncbi:MAG: DMT family transporter [Candidatus Micrarchaeota archaeon]
MNNTHNGIIAAIIAALFFGMGNPYAKLVLSSVNPLALSVISAAFSGVILAAIAVFANKGLPKFERNDLWNYLGIGILGFAIPSILTLYALSMTTALSLIIILRSEIFFGTIFGVVFFKEEINLKQIAGIVAGFIGVFIFATELNFISINSGDILALVATFFWSAYLIYARKLSEKWDPYSIAAIRYWVALPFLFALLIFLNIPLSMPQSEYANFSVFALSIYVFGVCAYNYAIRKVGIWRAAVPTQLLTVFFGAVITWLVLGETMSAMKWAGSALIVGGTVLAIVQKKTPSGPNS